jgi:hypothetical protein
MKNGISISKFQKTAAAKLLVVKESPVAVERDINSVMWGVQEYWVQF